MYTSSLDNLIETLDEPVSTSSLDLLSFTFDEIEPEIFEPKFGHLYKPGEVLDGLYEIKAVWTGMQGAVYGVWHRQWKIMLAMKTPHKRIWINEERRVRYKQEAETWIKLGKHPNIATAFYVRDIDNIPRIFSEFAEAGTLREGLTEINRSDWRHVLDIAIQLVDGLSYAHQRRLVHRDLKPANILMWSDGMIKLTDFGLATHSSEWGSNVRPVGTPAYMAPELWNNSWGSVGPEIDVYSLGIILYELLVGHHPFLSPQEVELSKVTPRKQEMLQKMIDRHLRVQPERMCTLRPDIPKELEELTLTCLAKDPQRRVQDLTIVRQTLLNIYEQIIGSSYFREIPGELILKAADRNNRGISFLDLGDIYEARRQFEEALIFDPQHPEATYNLALLKWKAGEITDDEMVTLVNLSASVQIEAKFHLGLCHIAHGDMVAARSILEEVILDFPENGLAHKYLAISLLGLHDYRAAELNFEKARQLLPDDQECRRFSTLVKALILDTRSRTSAMLHLNYESITFPLLLEDAQIIGWDSVEYTAIVHLNSGAIAELNLQSGDFIHEFYLSDFEKERVADIGYLGTGFILGLLNRGNQKKGKIWNLRSRQQISILPLPPDADLSNQINHFRYINEKLYCLGKGKNHLKAKQYISVCEPGYEEPIPLIIIAEQITSFAVYPDLDLIITGSDAGFLQLWRIGGAHLSSHIEGRHDGSVLSVELMPDRQHIVSTGNDQTIRIWAIQKDNSYSEYSITCIQVLTSHSYAVWTATTDSSGKYIGSCGYDNTLRIWDWQKGICLRTIQGSGKFSPSEKLAFVEGNRRIVAFHSFYGLEGWLLPNQSVDIPFELSFPRTVKEMLSSLKVVYSNFTEADQLAARGLVKDAYSALRQVQEQPEFERDQDLLNRLENLWLYGAKSKIRSCWISHTIQCSDPVTAIVHAGKSRILAAIGGVIELWDWVNKKKLIELKGHSSQVRTLFINSTYTQAISVDENRKLRIWDLEKGEALSLLDYLKSGSQNIFHEIKVNHSWTKAVSYSISDEAIIIWDLEIEEIVCGTKNVTVPVVGLHAATNNEKAIGVL